MEFKHKRTRTNEHDTKNMKKTYIEATFIEEGKYRFICTILIDGVLTECYVSSSSKLSKYVKLENQKVLVLKNKDDKLRTRFTLEAAIIKKQHLYLNFNNTNHLYREYLLSHGYDERTIQRETLVNGLVKTDFFINDIGCIEVKSLLSREKHISFPDKSSKRIGEQLKQYINLQKVGIPVTFAFIAMSKDIISLDWSNHDVKNDLSKAINLGLKIEAFSVVYEGSSFKLIKNDMLKNQITANL